MNDKQQLAALGEEIAERGSLVKEGYGRVMRILSAGHDIRHLVNWLRLSGNDGLADPFDEGVSRALQGVKHAEVLALTQELLAALEALVRVVADTPRPDPDDVFATIDEARQVINKARGEI